MVVWWEGVPDAILKVVVLTVGKVLSIAHCHLLATVSGQFNSFPEVITDCSFVSTFPQ